MNRVFSLGLSFEHEFQTDEALQASPLGVVTRLFPSHLIFSVVFLIEDFKFVLMWRKLNIPNPGFSSIEPSRQCKAGRGAIEIAKNLSKWVPYTPQNSVFKGDHFENAFFQKRITAKR